MLQKSLYHKIKFIINVEISKYKQMKIFTLDSFYNNTL